MSRMLHKRVFNVHFFKQVLILTAFLWLSLSVNAQIIFTDVNTTISFDFSATTPASVGSNPGSAFQANGFSPNPTTAGMLNSNTWSVTGVDDGSGFTFGDTRTGVSDVARGTTNVAVTQTGLYSFTGSPASVSNPMLLIHPGSDDFNPGSVRLRFRNDGPTPITSVRLKYDLYVRNDQNRAHSVKVNYSIDNVNYTNEPGFDYVTPGTSTGTLFNAGTFDVTMNDFDVPETYFGYIEWRFVDYSGSGQRDEIFLDNIEIEVSYAAPCTFPNIQTSGISFTNVGAQQMDVNFTRGNGGGGVLVVAVENAALSATPVTSVVYNANANFGAGDAIGNGFVVFNGNPTLTGSFTVYNLQPATNYRFYFFEYNTVSNPCYNKVIPYPNGNQNTLTPVTSPTGYFRTKDSGNWNDKDIWESSNDNITWVDADLKPTSSAAGIHIRNTHTVTLTFDESARLLVIHPGGMLTSTNASAGGWELDLVNDGTSAYDLIVAGVLELFGKSPINADVNTAATAYVHPGGEVRVSNNFPPSQSDDFAHLANRATFGHQALFNWNTGAYAYTTSGNVVYFNPSPHADTIPIFRMSQAVTIMTLGAGQNTTFNGVFENNATNTFQNSGYKIFRNGIIGTGELIQAASSGAFRISGGNAVLGGTGVITLSTNGLDIMANAVTNLINAKTVNNGSLKVLANGRLNCYTYAITGSTTFDLQTNGSLGIGSPVGITTGAAGNIQTSVRNFGTGGYYWYMGPGNQLSGNALPDNINRLYVDNATSDELLLEKDVTVSTNTFIYNHSVLNIGNNRLTLQGNVVYNPAVNNIAGLTAGFTGDVDGELTFEGTASPNIYFKTGGATLGKLLINKTSGTVTINNGSNPVDIYTGIEVNSGGLNMSNKSFTLKSTLTKTAYFGKILGTLSNATNITVERYIPTDINHDKSWQFLNVPLHSTGAPTINAAWQEGATYPNDNPNPGYGTMITGDMVNATDLAVGFDAYTSNGSTIKTYNPATETWDNSVLNTKSTSVVNSMGYMVFVRGDRSVITYNGGAVPTVLRATGRIHDNVAYAPGVLNVTANQFASIGNPYACPVTFSAINKNANIEDVFYVWDPLLNGYYGLGGFQTISGATGYLPSPGGTINFPTGVPVTEIQSGQAFLVHATGALGQMQFSESAKFNSTGNMVYRNSPTRNAMLTASMLTHQDVMADGNTVVFGNHFSNHYTSEDAIKYFNGGENFYLTRDGKNLSVETRKLPQHNDTLHYRIANLKTGTYTMKLAPVGFPHTNLKAYFIDKFSNRRVELSLYETISFSVEVTNDPSSKSAERFMVVFKQPELEDPYRNDVDPRVWITGNPVRGEKLFFQLNDFKSGMYVISIKTLNNKTLYSQSVYINEPAFKSALSLPASLPSATYLFTVTGAKTRVVTKWLKL